MIRRPVPEDPSRRDLVCVEGSLRLAETLEILARPGSSDPTRIELAILYAEAVTSRAAHDIVASHWEHPHRNETFEARLELRDAALRVQSYLEARAGRLVLATLLRHAVELVLSSLAPPSRRGGYFDSSGHWEVVYHALPRVIGMDEARGTARCEFRWVEAP